MELIGDRCLMPVVRFRRAGVVGEEKRFSLVFRMASVLVLTAQEPFSTLFPPKK